MTYLAGFLKGVLFIFLCSVAFFNTTPVSVRYFLDTRFQLPLIVLILACFVVGCALGALAMSHHLLRARRERIALKRQLRQCKTHPAFLQKPPQDAVFSSDEAV